MASSTRRSTSHATADGRIKLLERTGMMTFPQVFVGDELIGGFTETVQADRSGRLSELLAA